MEYPLTTFEASAVPPEPIFPISVGKSIGLILSVIPRLERIAFAICKHKVAKFVSAII